MNTAIRAGPRMMDTMTAGIHPEASMMTIIIVRRRPHHRLPRAGIAIIPVIIATVPATAMSGNPGEDGTGVPAVPISASMLASGGHKKFLILKREASLPLWRGRFFMSSN